MAAGRRTVVGVVAAAGAAVVVLVTASLSATSTTGTLDLRATLGTSSPASVCPPEAPAGADCHPRTGTGSVSGLGVVVAKYTWLFGTGDCSSPLVMPLATTGQFVVANKGRIDFVLAAGARCVEQEPVRNEPQTFTITGGTGAYQGASGNGTVERSLGGGHGVERWSGTLVVPGLEFDIRPPEIVGAVSKTVRAPAGAKRARVTYRVTARDAVDGAVGTTCKPRSGSFFKIGRTTVACTATDTSGNLRGARFVITVRR
ncbi:MAG: HYR domain-containing protein [Verrucomicrobiota bacterium]